MAFVNEANWDRALRVVVGLVLLILGWGGIVTGPLGTVCKVFGFLPLLTGLSGWCGLYTLLGIRTNKAD
jgi:hypothetical protein